MLKNLTSQLFLPKNVKPILYDLTLIPDFTRFTFDGVVQIDLKIIEDTNTIVLHAKDLKVKIAILRVDDKTIATKKIAADEENEKIAIVFEKVLLRGSTAKLTLFYSGILNDQMAGFYRSTYEVNGETRIMLSTQFEETAARMAFPCFDEPNIKASYKVTLKIPEHLQALSNMPVKAESADYLRDNKGNSKNLKVVYFEETPVMSTYLAAFCVGEFDFIEGEPQDGIPIRVYTTPGKKNLGHFALKVAEYTLRRCAEYFDHPYMGTKLDLIAIPNFAAGAMENLGLVTFREEAILIDENNSSRSAKRNVAITVAHEIVHMWFGDLVTMEWWEELWLNEAFATLMSFVIIDELFTDWKTWNKFVVEEYASALIDDALRTTHPIHMHIRSKDDIGQNFDAISYEKGGSVLRMLLGYIGSDAFRGGLRLYIRRHAYGNATTEDLWNAIEAASKKPVRAIMNSWVRQSGYPLLQIGKHSEGGLTARQSRFISSGEPLNEEESIQVWHIAANYVTGSGGGNGFTLVDKEGRLNIKDADSWIKLNSDQFGFFRVNYTPELWSALGEAVIKKEISPVDRMGVVDDLYALTRAGVIPAEQLLAFLNTYRDETEYIVWASIIGSLSELEILFEHDDRTTDRYHAFARNIVTNIAKRVGWNEEVNELEDVKMLRPIVLGAYGHYGNLETIARARQYFKGYCDNSLAVNPDLRSMVCRIAAKHGTEEDHDIVLNRYRHETHPEEKIRFLSTLGKFPHDHLIQKSLAFGLGSEVRSQDTISVIYSTALNDNPHAAEYTWAFIKQNWDAIHGRLGQSLTLLERTVAGGAQSLKSHGDALDVEQFFKEHPSPKISKAIAQTIEIIHARANWIERDRTPAIKWLEDWHKQAELK